MRVLFDTNIVLDVLLNRKEFLDISANLVGSVENEVIDGYLCATTITTIDYLISKAHDRKVANAAIEKLLDIFQIAEVNEKVLRLSLKSKFSDFEDAVQYYSGHLNHIEAIVTRNIKDYQSSRLPVYSPAELWSILKIKGVD